MIDTRNSYKIAKDPAYTNVWRTYYRPWWCPLWLFLSFESGEDDARSECLAHASPKPKGQTIHLGKLP